MKDRRAKFLAAVVALCLTTPASARVTGGVEMPEQVQVEGHVLQLNGASVQRKLFFRIYCIALYLERPTHRADEAIGSDQMKQIRLHMMHGAGKDTVAGALRRGFESNAPQPLPSNLRERLEQLLGSVPDVRSGADLVITYNPGVGTAFSANGQTRMAIPGKDFADALFSIWLGNQRNTGLKRQLLGG